MAEDLFDVIDAGADAGAGNGAGASAEAGSGSAASAATAGGSAKAGNARAGSAKAGTAKVRLRVHVRPGAGHSAVVGRYGDALHVRVAAPPVDGRANAACVKLLEDELGLRDIELVGGERSADKRFELAGVDVADLRRRLHELIEDAGAPQGAGPGPRRRRR